MGFCLSCGELCKVERCPRCKGKVSGATAAGLGAKGTWSARNHDRYSNKSNNQPINIEKLADKKTYEIFYHQTTPSPTGSDFTRSTSTSSSSSGNGGSRFDSIGRRSNNETSSTSNIRTVRERCGKCQFLLSLIPENSINFDSKKFHKDCINCTVCTNSITDYAFDLDGLPCCKRCFATSNNSSTSSSSVTTPKHESDNLKSTKPIITTVEKTIPIQPRSTITTNTANTVSSKGDDENDSSTPPTFSKTFNKLQANVNKKTNPTVTSLRGKPKGTNLNTSLSFADLLASRKSQETRRGSISRKPLTSLNGESLSKKSSLPILAKKSTLLDGTNLTEKSISTPVNDDLFPPRPRTAIKVNGPTPLSHSISEPSSINPDTNHHQTTTTNLGTKKTNFLGEEFSDEPLTKKTVSEPLPPSINSLGLSTIQTSVDPSKLNCNNCTKPIKDTWFKLPDDRILHKECFVCHQCQTVIEDGKYSVYENHEYHTNCLLELPTSPMSDASADPDDCCDRCHEILKGPCFTLTNGRQYHPNCFLCAGCKNRFEQGTYVSQGDQEYHKECVPKRDSLHCAKCTQPIRGIFVTNNNTNYHSECFRCTGCDRTITPHTPFGEVHRSPYCEPCLIQYRTHHTNHTTTTHTTTTTNPARSLVKPTV